MALRFLNSGYFAGSLGIGTETPDSLLHIYNSSTSWDEEAVITLGTDIEGTTQAQLRYYRGLTDATTEAFQIIIGSTTALTALGTSGNVGIGTTTPDTKFHIEGISTFEEATAGGGTQLKLVGQDSSGQFNFLVGKQYNVNNGFEITPSTLANGGVFTTPALLIKETGNVGIGTITPNAKLFIQYPDATTNTVLRTKLDAAYSMGISNDWVSTYVSKLRLGRVGASTDVSNMEFVYNIQGTEYGSIKRNYTASSLKFERGTNLDMIIDGSGNVGIGTTTPTLGKLQVQSATGSVGFNAGTSSSPERGNLYFDTDGTGWKFNIGKSQSGTFSPLMTFEDNGKVGIGTTSPRTKLEIGVSGSLGSVTNKVISATFDGGYSLLNSLQYNVNAFIGTTFGTTDIFAQTSGEVLKNFYVGLVSSNSYFNGSRYSITQGGEERLTVAIGGNVGIGTATPQSKLQVAGGIQMADDTATASATKVGTMRYRTGTEYVEVNGTELITNGDFATDSSWTKETGWSIGSGVASYNGSSANNGLYENLSLTTGTIYRLSFSIVNYVSGTLVGALSSGSISGNTPNITADGDYVFNLTATGVLCIFRSTSSFNGSIDNVSLIEVTAEDASYADMCMQTAASTYEWVNIVRNTY